MTILDVQPAQLDFQFGTNDKATITLRNVAKSRVGFKVKTTNLERCGFMLISGRQQRRHERTDGQMHASMGCTCISLGLLAAGMQ